MKNFPDLFNAFILLFIIQKAKICCSSQSHDFLLTFFLNSLDRFCYDFKALNQFWFVLRKMFTALISNPICLFCYLFHVFISLSFVLLLAFFYDFRPFWMKSTLIIFGQLQWILLIKLIRMRSCFSFYFLGLRLFYDLRDFFLSRIFIPH